MIVRYAMIRRLCMQSCRVLMTDSPYFFPPPSRLGLQQYIAFICIAYIRTHRAYFQNTVTNRFSLCDQ